MLEEKIRCEALPSILFVPSNEFNKLNNTGAQMHDSIYHMTQKLHLIHNFRTNTSGFLNLSTHNVTR